MCVGGRCSLRSHLGEDREEVREDVGGDPEEMREVVDGERALQAEALRWELTPPSTEKGGSWVQVGGEGQVRESLVVGYCKDFGFNRKGSFFLLKPGSEKEGFSPVTTVA